MTATAINGNIGDPFVNFKDFQHALGIAYYRLGDFRKAIEYHERHLKISKEVGDRAGEGKAYCNLGKAYDSLGDFQKAIESMNDTSKFRKKWETGQEKEKRTVILASPIVILEIFRKP